MSVDERQDDLSDRDAIALMRDEIMELKKYVMLLQKANIQLLARMASAERVIEGSSELTGKIIEELTKQRASVDPDDPFNVGHLGGPCC